MSDIPLSEQAPPAVDRGEPIGYPLGSETLSLASHMAATLLPGLLSCTDEVLSEPDAAALAVRMAVGILNEIRTYHLVDNVAVKQPQKGANV